MDGQGNVVEIKGLVKWYDGVRALDGVDIGIKRGIILGLLGPNGSGKSTLMKIMTGLVRPTSGSVLINGKAPSADTKANVAYLPEIDNLYSWMTVKETIDFVSSFYPDWRKERAAQMLDSMELRPASRVSHLSKGLRARLKLLLAMSRDVPLVLLDEPLSGIDIGSRGRIVRSIVSEYRSGEQTIVLSTHQVGESESIFEDVLFLKEGKVALYDSAESLREQYACSIHDMWEKVYEG